MLLALASRLNGARARGRVSARTPSLLCKHAAFWHSFRRNIWPYCFNDWLALCCFHATINTQALLSEFTAVTFIIYSEKYFFNIPEKHLAILYASLDFWVFILIRLTFF